MKKGLKILVIALSAVVAIPLLTVGISCIRNKSITLVSDSICDFKHQKNANSK